MCGICGIEGAMFREAPIYGSHLDVMSPFCRLAAVFGAWRRHKIGLRVSGQVDSAQR
jgi:hypothetical protein